MKIIVLIGIPGSGKSFYLEREIVPYGFQVICRDDIRKSFGGEFKRQEYFVRAIARTMCRAHMERSFAVAIDETNTLSHQIDSWLDLADEYLYRKDAVIVVSDIDVCIERREGFPVDVIHRMSEQLTKIYVNKEETLKRFDSIKYVMGHKTDIDPKKVLHELKEKYETENF